MNTAHITGRPVHEVQGLAWTLMAALVSMWFTLAACGTVIPRDSPPFGPPHTYIQPEKTHISAYLAPEDEAEASFVRIRFLVWTLKSLGELNSLTVDADSSGPMPAEELEFAVFDLSAVPVPYGPVGSYSGWICDREFPIGEDLPVVFYLECESGSASRTISSNFSHDMSPWPY